MRIQMSIECQLLVFRASNRYASLMQARPRPEHQCSAAAALYMVQHNALVVGQWKINWSRRQVLSEGRTCPPDPPGHQTPWLPPDICWIKYLTPRLSCKYKRHIASEIFQFLEGVYWVQTFPTPMSKSGLPNLRNVVTRWHLLAFVAKWAAKVEKL